GAARRPCDPGPAHPGSEGVRRPPEFPETMRLRSLIGAASRLHAAPPNRPRRMVPIPLHLMLPATIGRMRATLDNGYHPAKTMSPVGHPPRCRPTNLPDSP